MPVFLVAGWPQLGYAVGGGDFLGDGQAGVAHPQRGAGQHEGGGQRGEHEADAQAQRTGAGEMDGNIRDLLCGGACGVAHVDFSSL